MRFLLDTNVVSETRRPGLSTPQFREWMAQLHIDSCCLSAVTILELEIGAAKAEARSLAHAPLLRLWIDQQVIATFEGRILPVDLEAARRCAPLHIPQEQSYLDALIAATALVHDLTIVTRNTRHFEPMGVRLLNPWDQR